MIHEHVENGKLVAFTFSIANSRGEIVESSELPVTYVHGRETEIFPQVVAALEGHLPGDEVTVEISSEEAFGPHDPDLTFSDDLDNTPPEVRYLGAEIEAQNNHGEVRKFRVTRIGDGQITVDANHPLAGESVIFTVMLTEVREPTADELAGNISRP